MSIWGKLGGVATGFAVGGPVGAVVGGLFGHVVFDRQSPEDKKRVAFTVGLIALSAKMAKADGVVTDDEILAFRDLFHMPAGEERNVARLFDLAKQDVAGYQSYARKIAGLFDDEPETLHDIIDGLFHIAKADGLVHEKELHFLEDVAGIFKISDTCFERIKLRHVHLGEQDPYFILGAERDWDAATLKKHYRKLVADNHPDRLQARGVPEEFVCIATDKMAAINAAYDAIAKERRL